MSQLAVRNVRSLMQFGRGLEISTAYKANDALFLTGTRIRILPSEETCTSVVDGNHHVLNWGCNRTLFSSAHVGALRKDLFRLNRIAALP
eukprot:7517752-Pyramimonas_sp.AAC.1